MSATEHRSTAMNPASVSDPEPVTVAGARLGEGPVWDEGTRRLLWVDIWGGLLNATSPVGGTTTTDLGAPLSSVVLTTRGTCVVTAGLCVLELTGEGARHLADLPEDPCMRANDAAVDPSGRLWIGTMTMPHRPARTGGLWRLDPGSDVPVRILDDVRLANGIAWSPSGDSLYFVDSLRQRVDAYPFDPSDGSIGPARPFLRVADEDGMPDGIAVDADGGVWVALAGGGAVRRYGPSGTLEEHVTLPTRFPTSCAFGGTGLRDLFITTGTRPVPPPELPGELARGAGALFRVRTGVRGLPSTRMVL
jgi:sugar lactone lactonase YvrE